ncbi:LysR family transcriptional regulator [Desulfobulbus sp.]|uniref:LysR family transcriptional regulator n=1 Tax=Desulfobulbus sp. TaxID=895 RepID=UPI0027BA74F8|nr:LysR family transcriptional regulator [Desulfobulbus sp.]
MDTNTLQAFLAVADAGSFSLAAEQLFLTQPAVSKRVAALEEELAVKLFERLGRSVLLTEAGRTLLPRAQRIFKEMAESRRSIADLSVEVGGVLQLATSHHVGLHRLPAVLRDYSRRYPKVAFDLQFMDSEAGCAAVAAGTRELAVVTLPWTPMSNLVVQPIWDDPLMVTTHCEHPLAKAEEVLPHLQLYPLILPEKGTVTRRLIEAPFEEMGLQLMIGVETNSLETIRMLVSVGLGWSVLPLSMLQEGLVCRPLPDIRFFRELGLVTRRNRNLCRAAQVFCEMLPSA